MMDGDFAWIASYRQRWQIEIAEEPKPESIRSGSYCVMHRRLTHGYFRFFGPRILTPALSCLEWIACVRASARRRFGNNRERWQLTHWVTGRFPYSAGKKREALHVQTWIGLCQRLIVEVATPAASFDLTRPGAAERLLLERVRNEVGAGIYPNSDRTDVDVAEALIRSARGARQGSLTVTASELLRRAQLRSDFGAVARAHPVDRATEVPRTPTVAELVQTATDAADKGDLRRRSFCSSVRPDKGSRGSANNWYIGSWMRSGWLQSTTAILVTRMENGVLASSQRRYLEVCWDGSPSMPQRWLLSSGQDSRPPTALLKMPSSLHSGMNLTAVLPC